MSAKILQADADKLLQMAKYHFEAKRYSFPNLGESLQIKLRSKDEREEFYLSVYQGKIELKKKTFQMRGRAVVILARLDLNGPPHRNPDGELIPCPHLHVYREGYGDKWAFAIPTEWENHLESLEILDKFLSYCNVVEPPIIDPGIFT